MDDKLINGDLLSILLVEDNPADVRLTMEALKTSRIRNNIDVVNDGEEAMAYLKKEGKYKDVSTPDLILLDLNLPRKDGREVLKEVKEDDNLKRIPVVVLTTSRAEEDIIKAYEYQANSYIAKPVDFKNFLKIVHSIENFWFNFVKLPKKEQ
ncbi:MAG: response regulator [Armatimonadota bacterium]